MSRARAALRRALENIVVDAETGMTAADQLSTVMKKAKTNARQIGQGLAALALVFAVGLGFWNWTSAPTASQLLQQVGAGAQQQPAQPAAPQATTPAAPQATAPSAPTAGTTKPAAAPAPTAKATATQKAAASLPTVSANDLRAATLPKVTEVIPGTDANGVPQGFLVADQTGVVGEGTVNTESTGITKTGTIVTTSDFITVRNGVNVMLHQTLTWANGKLAYKVSPMVRVNGEWRDLPIASQATEQSDLADGSALITTHILVDTTAASTAIAGPGFGVDAQHLPAMLVVRIHTSSSGYPVFGEVVQVIDPLQVAH